MELVYVGSTLSLGFIVYFKDPLVDNLVIKYKKQPENQAKNIRINKYNSLI